MEDTPVWTRSSYCNDAGCSCVEVAIRPSGKNLHAAVRIRDSDNPQGPEIDSGASAWSGFLAWTASRQQP